MQGKTTEREDLKFTHFCPSALDRHPCTARACFNAIQDASEIINHTCVWFHIWHVPWRKLCPHGVYITQVPPWTTYTLFELPVTLHKSPDEGSLTAAYTLGLWRYRSARHVANGAEGKHSGTCARASLQNRATHTGILVTMSNKGTLTIYFFIYECINISLCSNKNYLKSLA